MGYALQAGLRVDFWTPMGVQRPCSSLLNVAGVLKGSRLLNRVWQVDTITIIAAAVALWLCAVRAAARFAGTLDRAERRALQAELEHIRGDDEDAGDMTPDDRIVVRSPEMRPRTIPGLPPMASNASTGPHVLRPQPDTGVESLRRGGPPLGGSPWRSRKTP